MKELKLKRIQHVAVFCGSRMPADPEYAEEVCRFGQFLAGHGMELVYGGSNVGLMKLLADSVLENGGRVFGVFVATLPDSLRHPGVTGSLVTANLAERKAEMLRRADAVVALPGGFGTLDELFEALALRKSRNGHKHPTGILNIQGYFNPLLELVEQSVRLGLMSPRDRTLLKAAGTPELLFKQLAGSLVPENQFNRTPDET